MTKDDVVNLIRQAGQPGNDEQVIAYLLSRLDTAERTTLLDGSIIKKLMGQLGDLRNEYEAACDEYEERLQDAYIERDIAHKARDEALSRLNKVFWLAARASASSFRIQHSQALLDITDELREMASDTPPWDSPVERED